jgi:dTDP-6-deoxy-L-talose 4-dehydrogenase (NAD+)
MKILLTGATGFLGNHVIRKLLKRSCTIIATSRNVEKARRYPWFTQVRYIPCDLRLKQENFFRFFQQPDMLIHLAWEGLPRYQDLFHLEENLPSHCRFLKNMIEHGLKQVVVAGTCFEYGKRNGALKEEMATEPVHPYGLAKDTLRKYLEQLRKKIDFEQKWVRLFYLYGKGQSPHSLFSQLDAALERKDKVFNLSGGEQLRDYLPVETAAGYLVEIAGQHEIQGIVNCCSGTPVSIRALVEKYLETTKKNIHLNLGYYPYPDHEPMAFWGSVEKLHRIIKVGR